MRKAANKRHRNGLKIAIVATHSLLGKGMARLLEPNAQFTVLELDGRRPDIAEQCRQQQPDLLIVERDSRYPQTLDLGPVVPRAPVIWVGLGDSLASPDAACPTLVATPAALHNAICRAVQQLASGID